MAKRLPFRIGRHYPLLVVFGIAATGILLFHPGHYFASSDGISYISAAESLVHQGRFLMADGSDYSLWPPLFPMLITPAILLNITVAGWIAGLAGLAIVGITWFTYKLSYSVTKKHPLSLAISAVMVFQLGFVPTTQYAVVDLVHLALILMGWYYVWSVDAAKFPRALIVLAALVPLLRYIGNVIVLSWALGLFLRGQKKYAACLIATATIATAAWELRNAQLTNVILQRDPHSFFIEAGWLERLAKTLSSYVFVVPRNNPWVDVSITLAIFIFGGWLLTRYYRRKTGIQTQLPSLILATAGIYFVFLSLAQVFIDPTLRFDDRLLLPTTYAFALVVAWIVGDWWIHSQRIVRVFVVLACIFWCVPQAIYIAHGIQNRIPRDRARLNNLRMLIDQHPNIVGSNGFGEYFIVSGRRVPRIPPPTNQKITDLWIDKEVVYQGIVQSVCVTGGPILIQDPQARISKIQLKILSQWFTLTPIETRDLFTLYQPTARPDVCNRYTVALDTVGQW